MKILALQTNEPFSKFLCFLSHNLFVKRFFWSETVDFSLKIEGFWPFSLQNRADFTSGDLWRILRFPSPWSFSRRNINNVIADNEH